MDSLPSVNASLNAIAFVVLLFARREIAAKRIARHRALMITAYIISIVFLVFYLLHKWHLYTTTGSYNRVFLGTGVWRPVYFTLLISHVVLAAAVPVLATMTLLRGLRMKVEAHRRIARWTFPIWMYVSVTGVLVYFMLYRWFS